MNILFLTMTRFVSVEAHGIYTDLMRKFRNEGHHVYVVTPHERRTGEPTSLVEREGVHVLGVRTLNVQKTNVIEKGIGQVSIEKLYSQASKSPSAQQVKTAWFEAICRERFNSRRDIPT